MEPTIITIETTINAPVQKVWEYWTKPEHITKWNFASDDWHAPFAENDLRQGGKFVCRMEAKDGSFGFDFGGVYTGIKEQELINYTMGDNRKVMVFFNANGSETTVTESFEAEETHSIDLQKSGWQAILNNFKKHVEES